MMYIVKYFLKLILTYFILAIVTEAIFANLQAHSIDQSTYKWVEITLLSLSTSLDHACKLQWKSLKAIQLSVWVFHNKIHYILIVLVGLVLYYHYKDYKLKQPNIPKLHRKDPQQYEHEKKEFTHEKVTQLVNSKQYKKFIQNRQWNQVAEEEETDGDWDRAEEQLFDQ